MDGDHLDREPHDGRMTGDPTIDYETLALEAMRGVVRTVLTRAAKSGLPGDHHFYISFDTEAAGVSLSKRLREKYPREMTIVLQHRFWDLNVADDRFEVKLTFDGIPERLVVPFAALKVFFDPSVRYGLQFEEPEQGPNAENLAASAGPGSNNGTRSLPSRPGSAPRKPRGTKKSKNEPALSAVPSHPGSSATSEPIALLKTPPAAPSSPSPATGKAASPNAVPETPPEEKPANAGSAQILSLDQFRKK